MMRIPPFACAVFLLGLFLAGCGEKETAQPPQPPPSVKKVAVPTPQPPAGGDAPAVAAAAPYKYDPAGRRDPFAPLLAIRRTVPGESNLPMTPLQAFDLAQLRLVAVIVGKGAPRAMVVAPDGKGYILEKGIKVGKNNGTVVAIRNDAVLVKERYYDMSGEIRENTLEIQVTKREGV